MVLAISISKQETDFGKSISERTGMYMGITDVTAGGTASIRIEMPQVSSPAPQRAPKPEVKAPARTAAPAAPVATTAQSTADVTAQSGAEPMMLKAQNAAMSNAVRDGAQNGKTGERAAGQQRADRAGRVQAQNALRMQNEQRAARQQEGQKPAEQESYYEKVMAEKAMENAEERLRSLRHHVRFGYNDEIERYTITITDADNQEVKKEIPSEEIQKMIEHLHTMKGMMFETEI